MVPQNPLRRLWEALRWRLERWRLLRPGPAPNPIRSWSGVLDPADAVDRHLAPLLAQLDSGIPHEDEFGFFATMEGNEGLFVDIGANAGQTAVSLRCVNRSLRILSFEPNPLLEPVLRRLRDDHLDGFDYRMTGLSDHRTTSTLYVPVVDGAHVTPLATLDRSQFDRPQHDRWLGGLANSGSYEIAEVRVELVPLDDLALEPAVVKIDAEEHEMAALSGMTSTLKRCEPLLMIEDNPQRDAIVEFLSRLGYEPRYYDPATATLTREEPTQLINVFYVPAGGWG